MNQRFLAALLSLLAPALFSSVSAAENRGLTRVGYLVASKGAVELKRKSWNDFHPVGAGTELRQEDQLRLGPEARAVVLCADFETVWKPTRGERSNVSERCGKPHEPLSKLPDGLAVDTRMVGDKSERILSPRGAIRDPAPRIRWESFGVRDYEVRVLLGSRAIWGPVLVEGTEQRIPPGFLKEVERPYRVQVRPRGTSEYVEPAIPFHLIGDDRRKKIEDGERKLLERFQDGTTERRLARTLYLAHQHFWDQALTLLDGVVPELESAAAELLGGRLALGLGFQAGASTRFTKARDLARKSRDIESEAEAFVGLSLAATKNEQKAEHYEAAVAFYEKLGDAERAKDLRGSYRLSPSGGTLEGLP